MGVVILGDTAQFFHVFGTLSRDFMGTIGAMGAIWEQN
jgi:hypothetical protein